MRSFLAKSCELFGHSLPAWPVCVVVALCCGFTLLHAQGPSVQWFVPCSLLAPTGCSKPFCCHPSIAKLCLLPPARSTRRNVRFVRCSGPAQAAVTWDLGAIWRALRVRQT